ncbi:sensor histidine kinase [Nocardioides pacificus]
MSIPTTTTPARPQEPGRPSSLRASRLRVSRLRLTAYAAAQLLMAVAALLLLVLTVAGGVLAIIWVGIPLLFVTIPATRWLADRHRSIAGEVLGTPIPPQYHPRRPGSPIDRMTGWASDPMTWRDLGWLIAAGTVGLAASLLTIVLFLAVVTGFLWWYGVEPIMRARCAMDRWLLSYGHAERLEQRVQVLTETRADAVDHSAAELRRLERDLHDGAQARLVALSMSLGLADTLFDSDSEAARRLVREARATSAGALGDLRAVVRGIHPPVLADRGLGGAVEALALDLALPVSVQMDLAGRPPAPVESALYFAVAECLTNTGKHAAAEHAWVRATHADGVLQVVVGDDGRGGADPGDVSAQEYGVGTGMLGVMRRLAAFDGTMRVSSPDGGPTVVTLEVPCVLSSPRTMPSCEPD